MKKVEITLQTSVFTRSSMNGDIGKVKCHLLAIYLKTEIVPVDGSFVAVRKLHVPVESVHFDDI